jgi:hypothetical protein
VILSSWQRFTGQRRRVPSWWVVLGTVAIVAVAWAVTSLAVGSGASGGRSVRVRPLLPGRLFGAELTSAAVERAFAAEGLRLAPAGSDLDADRFGRLRPRIAAAFELSGPSAMLVVLFDRPEPRAPMLVKAWRATATTVRPPAGCTSSTAPRASTARPPPPSRLAFRRLQ